MSNFVDDFTTECLTNGKCSIKQICEEAVKKIEEIDDTIKELYSIRNNRDNYISVLKAYNYDAVKVKGRKNRDPMINHDLSDLNEDDPTFFEISQQICAEIEKSDNPLTPRRIIDSVGFNSDPTPIYISLKWLVDKGILKRKEDRSFLPGNNWDKRKVTKKEA